MRCASSGSRHTKRSESIVADSFHIKPLMRILQSADRYQVLGLNRREMKLFEGNRDALDEIEPAQGVPRTTRDALGEESTESPTLTTFSPSAGAPAIRHGYGSKQDEVISTRSDSSVPSTVRCWSITRGRQACR